MGEQGGDWYRLVRMDPLVLTYQWTFLLTLGVPSLFPQVYCQLCPRELIIIFTVQSGLALDLRNAVCALAALELAKRLTFNGKTTEMALF